MAEKFYTILTAIGKAKLANSAVLGSKINFKTLKVGDGKGAYYEPSENQTSLVSKVWEGNINSISTDETNPNWIVIETIIPATEGGFFVREAGIFDEDGDMIAVSKISETYKPIVSEGSTKDLSIKIVLQVSNVDSITLKIDPTVVLATRKDIQILDTKIIDINTQMSEITNNIFNSNVATPTVSYGMNNVIKNTGKTSVSPKFTIQGKTVVNLLGKDGNCEDASKWNLNNATSALDCTNKVFGNNGLKIITGTTWGGIAKPFTWDSNKYYCFSAYLKNGNAKNILMYSVTSAGVRTYSSYIIDGAKFTRAFLKLKPSDLVENILYIEAQGITSGQYGYVDGIMLEEITQAQYNDANFTPSPYVDSYACLTNPYIEVRHDNLVRNGNGEEGVAWWTSSNGSISINNSKFSLTTTSAGGDTHQYINLKASTDYYIKFNSSDSTNLKVYIQGSNDNFTTITTIAASTASYTFNSGSYSSYRICSVYAIIGTCTFDSMMLVEGTTAPTEYKPCKIERCVIEGKFTSDDSVTYENGKVSGLLNWKHKTLYGKDYDWQYGSDLTRFKKIYANLPLNGYNYIGVKYDGKILGNYNKTTYTADVSFTNNINFEIGVSDSDTGWSENVDPNTDEVKAFMNGWRAIANNGTRYLAWLGIDASVPSCSVSDYVQAVTSTTVFTVVNGAKFSVGDYIVISDSNYVYHYVQISAINSNTITVSTAIIPAIKPTSLVMKADVPATSNALLNYCKNNIAPGYEGYQLHYKLQNTEPITDVNTSIQGDIPKFDVGDNYLTIDSGMVLGEVGNPSLVGGYYQFNEFYTPSTFCKYKTDNMKVVYKNNLYDVSAEIPFGTVNLNGRAGILQVNFDTNAIYTVDYKILATVAPQIGTICCSYTQDIVSVIKDLKEEVESKQQQDSVLDTLVDLSVYETYTIPYARWINYISWGTNLWLQLTIPFIGIKKTIPQITLSGVVIQANSTGSFICTNKFCLASMQVTKSFVQLNWYTSDAATGSEIKTNGACITLKLIADCRNRI